MPSPGPIRLASLAAAFALVGCSTVASSADMGAGIGYTTELLAAGFVLAAEGDFLRNPADTRDWNASPGAAGEKRGTGDRFVLKFVKS